uniref:Transmembrane protein 255B n=1 Tax=Suricata suricatta TaxID=37032 RepID=A0A673TTG6_SURSU
GRVADVQQSPSVLPEGFARRKKISLWFLASLLLASVCILTIGLAATTRTENVTVGGYYPGVILGFGAFLGIIGINLVENRRQMLVAAIVFISFGVVAAFCCAIVDGVFAARHIVSVLSSVLFSVAVGGLKTPPETKFCGAELRSLTWVPSPRVCQPLSLLLWLFLIPCKLTQHTHAHSGMQVHAHS